MTTSSLMESNTCHERSIPSLTYKKLSKNKDTNVRVKLDPQRHERLYERCPPVLSLPCIPPHVSRRKPDAEHTRQQLKHSLRSVPFNLLPIQSAVTQTFKSHRSKLIFHFEYTVRHHQVIIDQHLKSSLDPFPESTGIVVSDKSKCGCDRALSERATRRFTASVFAIVTVIGRPSCHTTVIMIHCFLRRVFSSL